MSRARWCRLLVILGGILSMFGFLWAGLGCSGQTTGRTPGVATPGVATTSVVQTGGTEMTATSATGTGGASTQTVSPASLSVEAQKALDQLREAARRTSFVVYFLGATYRNATIAGVMTGSVDSSGAPRQVDVVYRHTGYQDRLVVYLSQYDPAARPDLKKPLSDWTFVREVEMDGHTDFIYRGGSPANALFYVAQRGSTEISLAGYASAGYLTEEQLIEIAPLLVPVL